VYSRNNRNTEKLSGTKTRTTEKKKKNECQNREKYRINF